MDRLASDGTGEAASSNAIPGQATRASLPERIALGTIGLSMAVLGFDCAVELHGGMQLAWLMVGTAGTAMILAAVRANLRPFTALARLLRLPPLA